MKSIISILMLSAVLLMQQTLAERFHAIPDREYEDDLKFVKPPSDKSYALYDFIATELNNYTMTKMLTYGQSIEYLLKENGYSELQADLARLDTNEFMQTLAQLKEDKDNCTLQRKLRAESIPFHYKANARHKSMRFYMDVEYLTYRKMSVQFPGFFSDFLEKLLPFASNYTKIVDFEGEDIKNGIEPLTFWRWCGRYWSSTSNIEREMYFWNFMETINVEEVSQENEKPNCKWDYKIFRDFALAKAGCRAKNLE